MEDATVNPDDLARILDDLGSRLGPTGEHVFALAVRQQVVLNGLWAGVMAVVVVVALAIVVRQVRGMWSTDVAIDALEAAMEEAATRTRELEAKASKFEAEKDAANLAAMTEKQRAEWYERMKGFWFGSGSTYRYGYGATPSVSDLRDHNGDRVFVAIVAGIVAAIAGLLLLIALTPLLNPEYAAIRDILDAVKP